MEITGRDPLPYGIASNRQTLEEIIQYALEQRIIARAVTVEELFPPSTHRLAG
jgi:4,5-dihydroxyphthalate decarboxylase